MSRALAVLLCSVPLAAAAPASAAFEDPLFLPPEITAADIELPIVEAAVPRPGGGTTSAWTYGGTFPGPTIRRPAGARTTVTFTNGLDEALTVHRHGGHSTPGDDGQPDSHLIDPSGERTYAYDLDEPAAFEWYHDHRLDVTGRNVWMGLAGMFIIEDPAEDAKLGLDGDALDLPLLLAERSFTGAGAFDYPEPILLGGGRSHPGTGDPPDDDWPKAGATLLVNGRPAPHQEVAAKAHRLRLLNASNGRVMTFSLPGVPLYQVGTESGLLPAPVARTSITLGPAERAEVVADFSGAGGTTPVLKTAELGDALQFRVGGDLGEDAWSAARTLRPVPNLGTVRRSRTFDLRTASVGGRTTWTINGKAYSGARTDAEPKIDTTERWIFRAGGGEPHTVHVHGADFVVVKRDGATPPAWEQGLKETVLVTGETVEVLVRFTDHLGPFVFHCHVLEHEDNGMMGRLVVSEEGDPLPAPTATPTATPTPPPDDDTTTDPPPAAVADVGLRWAVAPKRLRPGRRARLELEARNAGDGAAAPASVAFTLPRGVTVKGKRKLTRPLAALAPGAAETIPLRVRAARRLRRSGKVVARLGARSAELRYRRSKGVLRLKLAAAARSFLCPLDRR